MPALPSCILEPLWDQFAALLPHRHDSHPLGCHRRRIPDRIIFDKLIQILIFRRRLLPPQEPCWAAECAGRPPDGLVRGVPSGFLSSVR